MHASLCIRSHEGNPSHAASPKPLARHGQAMRHAKSRKTFGKRLMDHPVIRHKLAEMARPLPAQCPPPARWSRAHPVWMAGLWRLAMT